MTSSNEDETLAWSALLRGRRQILGAGGALLFARIAGACGGEPVSGWPAASAATSRLPWATGGTSAMTKKASYPNPFASAATSSATCAVSCELTEGPCYSSQSVVIQDISYGYDGLPTRMYFRIVDAACQPIAGALVDVWHVSPVGKYSGDDAAHEDVGFCTGNDDAFRSKLYFRGKQTTDANGIVYFDTCYPGWYASRTIHVHLTISVGGKAYVTTQLCFADALDDEIVATQPMYKDRGARDTRNASDTVIPASDVTTYQFETQKMTDGALLAWKTIGLRSSLAESVCAPSGRGGGGGPAGPPGGHPPPGSRPPPPRARE